MIVAAAIVLIPGAPLIPILFLSQALNAVLLLVLLPFMRRLAGDPAVMGEHRLRGAGRATDLGGLRAGRALGRHPRRARRERGATDADSCSCSHR